MSELLNRDAILGTRNKLKTVDVEAFGGTVRIKELMARELREVGKMMAGQDAESAIHNNVYLVIASVVNEDGSKVFTATDAGSLNELAASDVNKVAAVASKLNHIGTQDAEDTAKN